MAAPWEWPTESSRTKDFVERCRITAETGAHGQPDGRDRWRAPTFSLMLRKGRQVVIITGLRFGELTFAIERVRRAQA